MTGQAGLCWSPRGRRGTPSGEPGGMTAVARGGQQTTRRVSCTTRTSVTAPWWSGGVRTSRWETPAPVTSRRPSLRCRRLSPRERTVMRTTMMSESVLRTK